MAKEHISSPKQNPNWISKLQGFSHHYGKTLLAALAITATMAGTEAKAQTSATINPDYYSLTNPFVVPNLPDRSSINIKIKTGKATAITMDDLASGQSIQIQDSNGELLPNNDVITLDKPGIRSWRYTNKEGKIKLITIVVNYEADIFDRTQNSLTENMRPEIIRVDAGQKATISAGKNMKYYKWKGVNDATFETGSATDSIKTKAKGKRVVRANDGTGTWGNDTMAVLEKPVFNKTTRKYDFPSTEKDITYRLYKYDLNGSETIADSTRTMVEEFIGDGNTHTSTTTLSDKSIYRISAQRTPATDEDTHLPSIETDFTNATPDIAADDSRTFRQTDKELIRDQDVEYYVYDLNGKIVNSGYNKFASLERAIPGIYIVKSRQDGQLYRNNSKIIVK